MPRSSGGRIFDLKFFNLLWGLGFIKDIRFLPIRNRKYFHQAVISIITEEKIKD